MSSVDIAPSGIPYVGDNALELCFVIQKGCVLCRSLTNKNGTIIDKREEFLKDRKAHCAAVVTEN